MSTKYTQPQIYLHWISAMVIIWATVSGFYIFLGSPDAETKATISFINVSMTTCFIPAFILRIIYCLKHPHPDIAPEQQKTHTLARTAHLLLYINISIVLITGVLMMERDINVFNILSIPAPLSQPSHTHFFHQVHILSCTTLALLVALHILAVIGHKLSGQSVMHRMKPW